MKLEESGRHTVAGIDVIVGAKRGGKVEKERSLTRSQ